MVSGRLPDGRGSVFLLLGFLRIGFLRIGFFLRAD
jgi:hypothetical protein